MEPAYSEESAYCTWNGQTWYYNKTWGYYYNRKGQLLHRCLWEAAHGTIPDGHEINHINHKRHDNRMENLELLTVTEHRRLTAIQRTDPAWAEGRSQRLSAGLRAHWMQREPQPVVCDICGETFLSVGMRAKRCPGACRREANLRLTRESKKRLRAARKAKGL